MANNPTSTNPGSQGTGQGNTEKRFSFNCADLNADCNWTAHGNSPEELRNQIAQHGREHHNIKEMGEDTWKRVKSFIHRKAA